MNTLKHSLMNFFDALFTLIYLNLLWFLFTLLGFFILGIGPATVTLLKALTDFRRHQVSWSFREFFFQYKKVFWKSNNVTWLFLVLLGGTLFNYRISLIYFSNHLFLRSIYLTLFLIFLTSLILAWANLSKMTLNLKENLKFILIELFRFPLQTIAIMLTIFIIILVLWSKFFILLFFGVVLSLYLVNVIHGEVLTKIVNLKDKYES